MSRSLQSFLQTRSLHQKLVLLSLVLLVISGFILVHSIVFTKHQMHDATGSEQSKMAQSFAAADKTADTATGPAKQLIDLTR